MSFSSWYYDFKSPAIVLIIKMEKMKKRILTIVLLMTTSVLFSQDLPTITIGTQVWASININASTFNDGSAIQEVKTDYEWNQALLNKKPAWCYYKNETANGDKYGKIY